MGHNFSVIFSPIFGIYVNIYRDNNKIFTYFKGHYHKKISLPTHINNVVVKFMREREGTNFDPVFHGRLRQLKPKFRGFTPSTVTKPSLLAR